MMSPVKTSPEDSVPKMLDRVHEYSESLCDNFCLIWPQDLSEKKTITELLSYFIMHGVGPFKVKEDQEFQRSVKVKIGFGENSLQITIVSPISKKSLMDMWPSISLLQEKFLFGADSKDPKELAEFMLSLDRAKLAVGRDKIATEYRKIKKRQAEQFSDLSNKYIHTPEFKRDDARLHELGKKIYEREIFKENPKLQLDDDLEILRLYREYGENAEEEYRKRKLSEYLGKQKLKIPSVELCKSTFPELIIKYCPKLVDISFNEIDKQLRIKNFSQRLEEMQEAFCLK